MNKWIKRGVGAASVAGLMLSGSVPALGAISDEPQSISDVPRSSSATSRSIEPRSVDPQAPVIKLPEPDPLAAH